MVLVPPFSPLVQDWVAPIMDFSSLNPLFLNSPSCRSSYLDWKLYQKGCRTHSLQIEVDPLCGQWSESLYRFSSFRSPSKSQSLLCGFVPSKIETSFRKWLVELKSSSTTFFQLSMFNIYLTSHHSFVRGGHAVFLWHTVFPSWIFNHIEHIRSFAICYGFYLIRFPSDWATNQILNIDDWKNHYLNILILNANSSRTFLFL